MLNVDLTKLAGGELQEKFNREITRVIQNMQDPNTPWKDTRSITIKLAFCQDELRDDAKVEISVSSKLSGVISAKTNFAIGKDLETGDVAVREYGKQIRGQMSFEDFQDEQAADPPENITKLPRQLKTNAN